MKLQAELQNCIKRMKNIQPEIIKHAAQLKEKGGYKNYETRLIFDCLHAVYTSSEICDLCSQYHCNDTHVETLGKQTLIAIGVL